MSVSPHDIVLRLLQGIPIFRTSLPEDTWYILCNLQRCYHIENHQLAQVVAACTTWADLEAAYLYCCVDVIQP